MSRQQLHLYRGGREVRGSSHNRELARSLNPMRACSPHLIDPVASRRVPRVHRYAVDDTVMCARRNGRVESPLLSCFASNVCTMFNRPVAKPNAEPAM